MKILVVENDDKKFKEILNILTEYLKDVQVFREKTRNGCFKNLKDTYKKNDRYDLLLYNNHIALCDDIQEINQYAHDIINEVKHCCYYIKVCIYSSTDIAFCDYDYFIKSENPSEMNEMIHDMLLSLKFIKNK